jgi:hypothetical protein
MTRISLSIGVFWALIMCIIMAGCASGVEADLWPYCDHPEHDAGIIFYDCGARDGSTICETMDLRIPYAGCIYDNGTDQLIYCVSSCQ